MKRTAIALLSMTLIAANTAKADPQGNLGITVGGTARGDDRELAEPAFHLGVRGDVLFLRDAADDFGIGPYGELFTHAFDELQVGHGVSLLIPTVDTFPLVFSAGGYGRVFEDTFQPGVAATVFVGARAHNFSSGYDMAAGLLIQGRVGLGSTEEIALVIAAHLDAAFLGLPIVYLIDASRGGSAETDEVRRE